MSGIKLFTGLSYVVGRRMQCLEGNDNSIDWNYDNVPTGRPLLIASYGLVLWVSAGAERLWRVLRLCPARGASPPTRRADLSCTARSSSES